MALINCPECNKEISDKGNSCPNCGYPLVDEKIEKYVTKNKSSKKKLIIISVLIVFVIAVIVAITMINIKNNRLAEIEKEKAEINTLLESTMTAIGDAGINASDSCTIILEVWDNAISDDFDFNSVFQYMFSGDVKNHEWSGLGMDKNGFSDFSWGSIANEMNTFKERLNKLETEKVDVEKKMEQIKQIDNDDFEKEVDAIVSFYSSYIKLYNAATNPSGNKLNYSSNLVTMNDDFNQGKVELEMLLK